MSAVHHETPPTGVDMARDVELAMALAAGRPTGPAADALWTRLRGYLAALDEPAAAHADSLPDDRARDIAQSTVRHARAVRRDYGGDPAVMLRLLAKAVDHLARYAAAQQGQGR